MKSFARTRSITALVVALCLLLAPATALAKKGEKNYNRGVAYEKSQQWEKAAQEFALAVAANPSDVEYQLHYRRAVFNASQSYMTRGRALAEQGDFAGAYNAFRQAAGYDPVNELAVNEMQRMLRLQREREGTNGDGDGPANGNGTPAPVGARTQVTPTGYRPDSTVVRRAPTPQQANPRAEQLQSIDYNGDLEPFIRKLAEELGLNVVFDQNFTQQAQNRKINIHLRDVTAAQTLDYIFKAHGLFFQRLSRRTIIVADQSKRPQYQELVLRTFYLYNIEPEEARTLIQTALPANAGRQPQVVINKATNSITVRDTPENIRIIGDLLKSIDKDKAEVVMEVNIYEVSRTDLLQIGNQLGDASSLTNLGGSSVGSFGGARFSTGTGAAASLVPSFLAAGVLIPSSAISLLQGKDNTRLIFSTQVHAFDSEKSETRIGAKVPVQTASVTPFGFNSGTGGNNQQATNPNFFGGSGFPVIQYEDTGLSLDFTPKVFPNQDVQVKMVIDTKDTSVSGSGNALTPTFTQRRITGTARVPNGRTMMIASIAQDRVSQGRQGLPLIGLIPILGRFVTAPRRNNSANDVVITLTPRVLRAPQITPRDEEIRQSGTMQTPSTETLEAMIREADLEDQLAGIQRTPATSPAAAPGSTTTATGATTTASNTTTTTTTTTASSAGNGAAGNGAGATAQQPAPEEVAFVPAPKHLSDALGVNSAAGTNGGGTAAANTSATAGAPAATTTVAGNGAGAPPQPVPAAANEAQSNLTPTPASAARTEAGGAPPQTTAAPAASEAEKTLAAAQPATDKPATVAATAAEAVGHAELSLIPEQQELKVGERRRVMLMLKTDAPLGLATATLRFDPRVVALRSVAPAVLSADKAAAPVVTQSFDPRGVLVLSVTPAPGAQPLAGEGLLLFIEFEGLAAGESALQLDADKVHLAATDGRSVRASARSGALKVIQ